VIYPDTTADPNDNPKRTYHYEDTRFPNHLTGVTDENGDRYSTFAYDAEGKAILTEHAQTINGVPARAVSAELSELKDRTKR